MTNTQTLTNAYWKTGYEHMKKYSRMRERRATESRKELMESRAEKNKALLKLESLRNECNSLELQILLFKLDDRLEKEKAEAETLKPRQTPKQVPLDQLSKASVRFLY